MTTTENYRAVAEAYATGVRELFTLAPTLPVPGVRGLGAPEALAERAESLAPLSAELTRSVSAQLAADDPLVRERASTRLLAKALTDLDVSAYLLQAAQGETTSLTRGVQPLGVEGPAGLNEIEARLRLLVEDVAVDEVAVRRALPPADVPSARIALANSIRNSLTSISSQAATTGRMAIGGLLGLGVAEVARAAGIVGMDIAEALGKAEQANRLYAQVRDFAIRAHESILALLGPQLAATAATQVVTWVDQLRAGSLLGDLLEKLYQTGLTLEELEPLVGRSQADLATLAETIQEVDGLSERYRKQIDLAGKLLTGMRFLATIPAAALPQGRLLFAATYILLGAYIVLAGGDFVDAPRLRLLNRVPGVRQIVQTRLPA